jgi:hypothetical protein
MWCLVFSTTAGGSGALRAAAMYSLNRRVVSLTIEAIVTGSC